MRDHRKSRRGRYDANVVPPAGETLDSFVTPPGSSDRRNYKDLQLCRQAYRALSVALAGGRGDEVLAGLVVRAVLPAPNATRLLVCLEPGPGAGDAVDLADVLARLEHVKPALRREVAEGLVRKRAPELEFVVMPREEVRP